MQQPVYHAYQMQQHQLGYRRNTLNDQNMPTEIIKTMPPVAVSTTSILGVSLSDWVYIATIGYIVIQIICILYKTFHKPKERKKA